MSNNSRISSHGLASNEFLSNVSLKTNKSAQQDLAPEPPLSSDGLFTAAQKAVKHDERAQMKDKFIQYLGGKLRAHNNLDTITADLKLQIQVTLEALNVRMSHWNLGVVDSASKLYASILIYTKLNKQILPQNLNQVSQFMAANFSVTITHNSNGQKHFTRLLNHLDPTRWVNNSQVKTSNGGQQHDFQALCQAFGLQPSHIKTYAANANIYQRSCRDVTNRSITIQTYTAVDNTTQEEVNIADKVRVHGKAAYVMHDLGAGAMGEVRLAIYRQPYLLASMRHIKKDEANILFKMPLPPRFMAIYNLYNAKMTIAIAKDADLATKIKINAITKLSPDALKKVSVFADILTFKGNIGLNPIEFNALMALTVKAHQLGLLMVDNKPDNYTYQRDHEKKVLPESIKRIDTDFDAYIITLQLTKTASDYKYNPIGNNLEMLGSGAYYAQFRKNTATTAAERKHFRGKIIFNVERLLADVAALGLDICDIYRGQALVAPALNAIKTYDLTTHNELYATPTGLPLNADELYQALATTLPQQSPGYDDRDEYIQFVVNWHFKQNIAAICHYLVNYQQKYTLPRLEDFKELLKGA